MMPILSRSQLRRHPPLQSMPVVLLAAVCASAVPYVVHDPMLFVSGSYTESLAEGLWQMVYEGVHAASRHPKLAVVQAALLYLQHLPTRHHDIPGESCVRSVFLGGTVALAMSLGLHLEPRPWGIPAWEKRLRRRLWWAVYLEDKWTSLLLGRPPIIRPDEWDVLDLDEGDFFDDDDHGNDDERSVDVHLSAAGGGAAAASSSSSSPSFYARVFPYFIRLARLAENIHQTFYTLRNSQRLSNNFRASIDAARPIREGLQSWYSGLPDDLRLRPREGGGAGTQSPPKRHHGVAVLHFAYLTLELLLYRAILRPLARSPPPPPISSEDAPPSAGAAPTTSPWHDPQSPWQLDDLVVDSLQLDQLPVVDSSVFGEAAEATINAAEKCAGIIVNFLGTLSAQDFDVLWYPWTSVCFATVTNFIVLLLVQAPTEWHATRSKELLDKWSSTLQSQHKNHTALMRLGLVRLHSLNAAELDQVFLLSPAAKEVLRRRSPSVR
ncbi:hypothetical protein VTK73DRAFT_3912 [Phialemonium thermophilum]|uniref:Xylanolytic transcriptional activator regulatory domain-containing protein n=1 Tax=Phialemonium thermophilum TaxID=223376 RepID=A0ABR3VF95_9PEZI